MSGYRPSQPHAVYEFGQFRLDTRRHLLFSRDGAEQHVEPRLIEALLYFIEHQGELLHKDRLLADLWPGLIVEENSLTQLVSSLREVLGESPRENRYLATVPGRGYRFVADVVRLPDPDSVSPEPPRPGDTTGAGTHRRRPILLFVTAATVSVLAITWLASDRRQPPGVQPDPPGDSADIENPELDSPATAIAVMPFENLSDDERHGYMAFGVAEGILHRLGNVSGLRVVARTSSFSSSLQGMDAREIGGELHARYLVEGSVQRAGERVRATAQLIDTATGAHVWSLRFDRTIDDVFAVEDEIAQAVADALQVSLREPDHPQARFGTQAYLEFLEGRALVAEGTLAAAERAAGHFREAIRRSPEFAAAYVALADAHRHIGYLKAHVEGRSPIGTPAEQEIMAEGGDKATPLLAKALALDENLGEAYVLQADLKAIAGDYAGAEADYRRGLALRPNYGTGYEHYGEFLMRQHRREDALAAYDNAILVDPLAARNYYGKANVTLFSEETGVFSEQAESDYLRALELDADYYPAMVRLAAIRWHQGRFADAVLLAERALAIDPQARWIRWFLAEFYLELEEPDAARDVLAGEPPLRWISICLYDGEPALAADIIEETPYARGFADYDVEAYVVRDAAIASGDLAQGRRDLLDFWLEGDPFALVTLAQLALAMGDRGEAERRARAVLAHVDPHARAATAWRLAYPRAAALTVLGQNDAAIAHLEDSFARGFRKRWWYAFDRDPAFDPLRRDERFLALAKSAHAHASAERERLAILRERGDVPARRASEKRDRAPC